MRAFLVFIMLAVAANAQPTSADSALVDRLLAASHIDMATRVMEEMGETVQAQVKDETSDPKVSGLVDPMLGAMFSLDPGAVADSVRTVLFDDFRPDLIREALTFQEGPLPDRVLAQSRWTPDALDPAEMLALITDPTGEPMADSTLSARYAIAMNEASQPPEMQTMIADALIETIPDELQTLFDDAFEPMGGFANMLRQRNEDQRAEQVRMMTVAARLTLADVDPEDIRAITEFYESDAGRYVTQRVALGTMRAQLPNVVASMRPMFESVLAQVRATQGERQSALPAPPRKPDPDVYEVVDVEPELIGGMEALSAGVVYPEDARRAGTEGQVIVQFVVDERGEVTDPVVLRSPSPLLSEAALDAVRAVRFTPGQQDGRPVKVRFAVPIRFRLTDPEPEPEVFEVVETPPRLIGGLQGLASRVVYPENARLAEIEGNVLVQFVVGTEGQVENPVIFRTAHPALNAAALAAVRGSRFTPGTQDGVPVRVRYTVPITFRLR